MVPSGVEPFVLYSPEFSKILGILDEVVETIEEPRLSVPSRRARTSWWLRDYPQLVRQLSPNIIFHPIGFVRGKHIGVPTVARCPNMLPFDLREIKRYGASRTTLDLLFWRARYARSFRKADGVIFLSEHSEREVSRQVPGIKKSTIIPNGIGTRFKADVSQERPLNSPIKILYVSTIFLYKHQWNVVEAVTTLRRESGLDLRLKLVGGGEPIAMKKLARRIRELNAGSFTTVTGAVPLDEMPAVYRDADLFVFASSCESFANTLGEAMAAGLPIACSKRVSMPGILKDAGVYFDPENTVDIAAAIQRLLANPDLRLRCARKAREYVEEYTSEETARRTYDFLQTVSQGPK
jgi:glycosyltransferase involved in cell wall biosynthesis